MPFDTLQRNVAKIYDLFRAEGVTGVTVDMVEGRAGPLEVYGDSPARRRGYVRVAFAFAPRFCVEVRAGVERWFRFEDSPYPVELSREDILARVLATKADARFCGALLKYCMRKSRRPPGRSPSLQLVMAQATDHDLQKAYGLIGPLRTREELDEETTRVRDGLRGKPIAAKEPEPAPTPEELWPFEISPQDAQAQVDARAEVRARYETVMDWVAHNFGRRSATPEKAPSNIAWQKLVMAMTTDKGKADFFKQHDAMEEKRRKRDEEDGKHADDARTQFRLLDACKREREKQRKASAPQGVNG